MRRHLDTACVLGLTMAMAMACGGNPDAVIGADGDGATGGTSSGGTESGGSSSGGSSSGGTLGAGGSAAGGSSSGGSGGLDECGAVREEATEQKRPMDIIIAIDNSASMAGEIEAVQQRINDDFAQIIEDSGIDYRVIMVSRYGNVHIQDFDDGSATDSAFAICVGAPLSSLTCPVDDEDATSTLAHNAPRFFHHSTDIGSRNLWCRMLDAFDTADPYPNDRTNPEGGGAWPVIAPDGWSAFVREEAFKVFIAISDDAPSTSSTSGCPGLSDDLAGAEAFDQTLRALSPVHFGAYDAGEPDANRNYAWYSIVGMAGNDQTTPTPLGPEDPVEDQCCEGDGDAVTCPNSNNAPLDDGVRNGEGYQELSRMTGALRYPSCYNDNFDDIFNAIAVGIIEGAKLSCEWAIPDPPAGEVFDQALVNVQFEPGDGGDPVDILKVPSQSDCDTDGGWYYDDEDDPTQVLACPATCDVLEADPQGKVAVLFGCETQVFVPR